MKCRTTHDVKAWEEWLIKLVQEAADAAIAHLDNEIAKAEPGVSEEEAMAIHRERVKIGCDDDGNPIYKKLQASSKDALHLRIAETMIEYNRLPVIRQTQEAEAKPKNKTLFAPYCEQYFESVKKPRVRQSTYHTYQQLLKNHVYPVFGERYVEDITARDIIAFMNDRAYLSKAYLDQMRIILKSVLTAAVEEGIISTNPAESSLIKNPSKKEPQVREALSEEQIQAVQAELLRLENREERLLLALIMYTGMRKGEAAALRWDDIDFENGEIHICRTVSGQGKQTTIELPKTKSGMRTIPLLDCLRDILLPLKGTGFVITGDEVCKEGHAKYLFNKRIKKNIDLYGACMHVFRHTYASMLASNGTDIKTIQAIIGHSDIQTTMDRYVHPNEKNIRGAGAMMNKIYKELSE